MLGFTLLPVRSERPRTITFLTETAKPATLRRPEASAYADLISSQRPERAPVLRLSGSS